MVHPTAAAKKKRSGPSTATTTERITLRAVLQQLKDYDKSRMARESELIHALRAGAPTEVKADPAKLDAHVAALRALCPRTVRALLCFPSLSPCAVADALTGNSCEPLAQFLNFVNGTANTSATQTAHSMLLTQVEEDRKKKRFVFFCTTTTTTTRTRACDISTTNTQLTYLAPNRRTTEIAALGRELAPHYTTFDLISYLTAANPLVTNFIENRLVRFVLPLLSPHHAFPPSCVLSVCALCCGASDCH